MVDRAAFSESFIRSLKPRSNRYSVFDADTQGFGIRVTPRGKKTYVCQGQPLGSRNQTTITLGPVNGISLNEARKKSQECLSAMLRGQNPNHFKDEARTNTLERLIIDYCLNALEGIRTKRTIIAVLYGDFLGYVRDRNSKTGWAPGPNRILRERPVIFLEKREILDRLDEIRKERGKHAARSAMAKLRAALNWASSDGRYDLQINVAAGFTDKTVGFASSDELRRTRVLNNREIKSIWDTSTELGTYGQIIRLLFLTAARKNEIARAEWKELDGNLLIVPPHRFKAKREHHIPLVSKAMEIIDSLPRTHLHLLATANGKPLTRWHSEKAKLDRLSGVTDWVVHDIRRTVRTNLEKLRIPRHICELIVGHSQPSLVETYNRYDALDEQREALIKWQDALLTIINPSPSGNVVPIRAAS